jgi:hypothetical protein
MIPFLLAAGLLLHTCWWGAGLAAALMPRRWRGFWPVFMPVCGWALQSFVVWCGAWLDVAGTDRYAWASQVLPAGLLIWQVRRQGIAAFGRALRSVGLLGLLMAVVLAVLVRPLARVADEPTTASLGSCDAADYAAGARLFQEFRRSDRGGFLGQTEVVQVHSADNFYDVFLLLNHFTPAALVAHHASVFGRAPHELISLLTVTFLAGSLPLVFWLARATLRLRSPPALFAAAVYGLSAVNWYAVFHVAMAQFLAAQAITVLTIAGVAVWRELPLRPSAGWRWAGLLMVAYGLIFGAYNFIILVALAPAGTWVLGGALVQRRGAQLGRWILVMGAPLLVAGLLYAGRVGGLVERFLLFQEYDFGWKIPGMSPEGWLGLVDGPSLHPWPWVWRIAALVLFGLAWGLALVRRPGGAARVWLVASLTVPAVAGYGLLLLRGAWLGTNASYDAYKLLSVFYPGLLAALVVWWPTRRSAGVERVLGGALALLLLIGNAASVRAFTEAVERSPLVVDPPLAALQQLEQRPEIRSINVLTDDMWSRLWANAFLLRREQYFATHTYEGRRNTALQGAWELTNELVTVREAGTGEAAIEHLVPSPYQLRRSDRQEVLRVAGLPGWYEVEQWPQGNQRWRWMTGGAELVVENPGTEPVRVMMALVVRSGAERPLEITMDEQVLGRVAVGLTPSTEEIGPFELPPGASRLRFDSPVPAAAPGPQDGRLLLACIYRLELIVVE